MEADSRLRRACVTLATGIAGMMVGLTITAASAANYRTQNFLIQAPDAALAKTVGDAAERYRNDLATYWLGRPLPAWPTPCPVRVVAGSNLAAQGVTTYNRAPVRDFQMEVIGTPERILDSVLPHEVTHTILATHFGRPLPRWADEGICTTVEHESEKNKHEAKLREFLKTRRGIAMNQLFLLTEYPNDVLPMYAQGYSVCRFLIEQQDAPTFIAFLTDYMRHPSWTDNIKKHYGYESLGELQQYWLSWVSDGSGPVARYAKIDRSGGNAQAGYNAVAGNNGPTGRPATRNAQAGFNAAATEPSSLALNSAANPAAGPVGAGPATRLIAPANPSASRPSPATALASTSSDGWYQRKRQEAVTSDPQLAAAPTIANPMVPPSVRNSGRYKTAQPQPEVQLSRGGDPVPNDRGGWSTWADGSPRYR
ncbi:hypothetical protein K227x_44600 [Rubripirellula lacrimiformis]|uniref:Peptidase MA-like domain-containing protein n=1 Tax=Rubripirellula lacrimiformis TaxID=1930273 RepID=A0A517NG43_9BACT|nr:hypothetical protein [Rubripirellula lacrimiformis]QDT06053.1 hypothetical protein K227x_44600 [Rubripirellula lacrimiformis]